LAQLTRGAFSEWVFGTFGKYFALVEGLGDLVEGLSGKTSNPQLLVDAYFSSGKLRKNTRHDYS